MFAWAAVDIGLRGLSAATTGGLAIYAWRRRDEPGACPFVGLMAAVTFWSVCAAATVLAHDPGLHLLIERVRWVATAFVPVFWILFAMTYTGYDELISAQNIILLSIIPLVTIVLAQTNPVHGLVWADSYVYVTNGVPIVVRSPGIWYPVFVTYAYALLGIGSLLILRLVFVSDYLFVDQATLLVVGTVVPLVSNALSVFGLVPIIGLDLTSFAFTVTGLAFGYALFSRQLFELVPATRRLGRDAAIATLDDGVLILDNRYQVICLNPEAADVLDCDPQKALGTPAEDLVDTDSIDFDVPDALAELQLDGHSYEARTSTITDRRDREIGHTVVLHDVTARKHRERRLRRQRDELQRLDHLNEVIHEITQAFVSATTREAIEEAVCDRLAASNLYSEAMIIVDPTDEIGVSGGDATMERTVTPRTVPTTERGDVVTPSDNGLSRDVFDTDRGSWTLVPLGLGQSIYGALALYTTRPNGFDRRELAILDQLGDTISQAMNAVVNKRLLLADAVTELEFRCPDAALAEVAEAANCRLSLRGLVRAADEKVIVYSRVENGSATGVADAARGIEGIADTQVIDDEPHEVVEFTLTSRSALLPLSEDGMSVRTAEAVEEEYRVVVEVPLDADIRTLVEHVREYCSGSMLAAKRDLDRPTLMDRRGGALPEGHLEELTDRQLEVLEAAYRAGYFRWPRDRTAEEVADSIGISSPTLHKHLRRAEERLLTGMFDVDARDNSDWPREQE